MRQQFRQVEKADAVQERRRTRPQHGHGGWIGPVGPFPWHGKRAVGSPLEDQRFNPPDPPEFEDREPLSRERVEWVGDFRRSRKGAAVTCSYR